MLKFHGIITMSSSSDIVTLALKRQFFTLIFAVLLSLIFQVRINNNSITKPRKVFRD